jgi:hypothetical protein
MLISIAILVAFFGGLVGKACSFRSGWFRLYAFLIPILVSTALLYFDVMLENSRSGLLPRSWAEFSANAGANFFLLLVATLFTGLGWLCSCFVQALFED